MEYVSQLGQDRILDVLLKQKENGYFLDIGANFAKNGSNSYFFEKYRGFKGIAVEMDPVYQGEWSDIRKNSIFILSDANALDYESLLTQYEFPKTIDVLSVDIDPNTATFDALKLVMNTSYQFNVIAFETDYGGDLQYPERFSVRDPSRSLLCSKGYVFIQEVYQGLYHVDDIWVHRSFFDYSVLSQLGLK